MAPDAITNLFSLCGAPAKTKLLLLDSSAFPLELMDRARSLHIEHVSPAGLAQRKISRRPGPSGATEAANLALMRHWFFARKPDAGFLLTDFPATLLQAKVFDEWLETRGEGLNAVLAGPGSPEPLVSHYRALGLLTPLR